jgi:hypothetical protein
MQGEISMTEAGSEDGDEKGTNFRFLPEFAEAIAEAANSWTALEYAVNTTIWALADVKPALGACLTAQIYTMPARMDALLSLMKLRQVSDAIIDRTNKFVSQFRDALDARNRTVHDYWMNDRLRPESMGKLVITAQKVARFRIVSVEIAELKNDVQKIHERRYQFEAIRRAVDDALPSLPRIPPASLYPITETPTAR